MKFKRVKICTGPGCRAWEAEEVFQRMGDMQDTLKAEGYRMELVACMNKCGGGACVQVTPGKYLFKLRKPDEVSGFLPLMKAAVPAA